ncbi:MAG: transglycosylase SLT domain-containing protein [Gemmatimonadetes bacterium]|nr:transglycosylase SLT domain-containing protein [Gemmatimonadota bacterium]
MKSNSETGSGPAGVTLREVWLAGMALALVAAAVLALPGRLGRGERLDRLARTEDLIARTAYRNALQILSGLDLAGMDEWAIRRAQLQRALCLKALGRFEDALAGFRAVEKASEAIREYMDFWQAECHRGLGRADSALVYYARVLDTRPSGRLTEDAALLAAGLHLKAGQASEAAGLYRRLPDGSERKVRALAGLAVALNASGDSTEARRIQLRLVRDHPESPESLAALGSMGLLRTVQERFYAAIAYSSHGRSREAVGILRQIARESGESGWRGRAQQELGLAHFKQKDYRTAQRAFQEAHRRYRVPKALFYLGRCSVKLGLDLKAAGQFQSFASRYPATPGAAEALWQAAMAYERRGRRTKARKVFLNLAARYPRSRLADRAGWRAGYALFRLGRFEEAARVFMQLADRTSENYMRDQGCYWTGKSYQRAGRPELGAKWLRRAAAGFPSSYYASRARAILALKDTMHPPGHASPDGDKRLPTYVPSPFLLKGDRLADLGLYEEAEQEYRHARWAHRQEMHALGELQRRFERIGAMNQALRISGLIVNLERERGVPISLNSFRRLYPTYYWGEISRTAGSLGLDPNLVLAIIRQESAFDDMALSRAGARGLMQVMPATGRQIARKLRLKGYSTEDLWDPNTSIRFGARHLADHFRYFRNSKDRRLGLALSAYNAGLDVARKWSARLPADDVDDFVESIPYRETRNYVKLVYRNYQVYSYLQQTTDAGG